MESREFSVFDVTETIPRNPHYSLAPLRAQEITHIVWHDCGQDPPYTYLQLVKDDLCPNYMSERGNPCPRFTYYIQADLTIWQLTPEDWRTWHAGVPKRYADFCPKWNEFCLGIGFEFYGRDRHPMPPELLQRGLLLTAEIALRKKIAPECVFGHRELAGTGHSPGHPERIRRPCPGMGVDMRFVRSQVETLQYQTQGSLLKLTRSNIRLPFPG